MTGIAVGTVFAIAVVAGAVHALRRRRREFGHRPLVLATPGGRAFAAHLGSRSDIRMGLELPRRR